MRTKLKETDIQLVSQEIANLCRSPDPNYREAGEIMRGLFKRGYLALYGGSKGHGFWIRNKYGSVINPASGCNWWGVAETRSLL